jgi:signal transduction histidine kinase
MTALLRSFRIQLAAVAVASLAMLALASLLIHDVLTSAERRLTTEARQQCAAAAAELGDQYEDRAAYGGEPIISLPPEAQDVSLRGLSRAVLRSYEGVEGGYYRDARVIGYSGEALAPAVAGRIPVGSGVVEDGPDTVVIATRQIGDGPELAWAAKRVSGAPDDTGMSRRLALFGLALAALLATAALVSVWLGLRRGVAGVKIGLERLAQDLTARLPETGDDFGQIARAVNRMAERRATLEAEVRRQDRLAALGRAVAGVAHEIRNPLNSMRLTLELLHRRLEKGRAVGEEALAAIREVDRLDLILGRLLAFGRPPLEDRRTQAVAPVVQEALAMVEQQARQKSVRTACYCAPLEADIDAAQITQVLVNLLLNAIEAAPPGSEVRVVASEAAGGVRVAVQNGGPSIPDPVRPHVFDAFFTTKHDGTGLGLAVSREIVANHGGELAFESDPGQTTFGFVIPAARRSG